MKRTLSIALGSLLLMGALVGCSGGANPTQASYVSMDNARTAALAAAGVDAAGANITSTQLSEHNGIAYYEVKFTAAGMEYGYSVDAMTGVVIEAEEPGLATPPDNGGQVTDYDTANSGGTNISAGSGSVVSGPSTTPPTAPVTAPSTEIISVVSGPSGSAAKGTPSTTPPTAPATAPSAEITLEKAKQIALNHAGKTADQVSFVKVQKEFDDWRWEYEIEFVTVSGNSYQEYDYEIDASTGKVLNYDYDAESYTPQGQGSATKTEGEVQNIVLARVPGATSSDIYKFKKDFDDGRLLYEGKIIYDTMEYEFEVDAYSGTVLEWKAESIYD